MNIKTTKSKTRPTNLTLPHLTILTLIPLTIYILIRLFVTYPSKDFCSEIPNSNFKSLEKHDKGLGPHGVVLGYWHITFKNNSFTRSESDYSESGTFTCQNNQLQLTFPNRSSSTTMTATYDQRQKLLTIGKIQYKKNNP